MVFTIEKSWKEFNINLEEVSTSIKAIDPNCCGISANSCCQVHFTSEPSEENKILIDNYWDSITPESNEAITYKSKEDIFAQTQSLKEDALTKSYDNLSIAQRKLLLGMTPTLTELFD